MSNRSTPDVQAGAPRKPISEQRAEPFAGNLRAPLNHDEIQALIAPAAYYRAQKRGFAPGHELEDWIEAENEVMTRLGLWP